MKFSHSGAFVDRTLQIPCGRCAGCRLEKARQWAVRAQHEASLHENNSFITLTYREEDLPEDGSLVLAHWQNFAKKLRRDVGSFRFMMCGEYGEKKGRPHMHALLFGIDFHEDRELIETEPNKLWESKTLNEIWGKGDENPIGAISFESASYVARYTMKKVHGKEDMEKHYGVKVDEQTGEVGWIRKPEFATMSRNPGLGKRWFEKYWSEVYPADEVIMRGHQAKPPRYYDGLLEEMNPKMWREVRMRRVRRAEEKEEKESRDGWEVKRIKEGKLEREGREKGKRDKTDNDT